MKGIIRLILFVVLVVSETEILALELTPNFHVGAMSLWNRSKVDKGSPLGLHRRTSAAHGFAGVSLKNFDYMALEGGYMYFNKNKQRNVHLDIAGIMPITDIFRLIGTVGMGRTFQQNLNLKNKYQSGFRLGAGMQFKLLDRLDSRVSVNHQKGSGPMRDMATLGAGLVYRFE